MRLVLDTNVVASGLLWGGAPASFLNAAETGQVELFTSQWLLAELDRILRRPKFDKVIAAASMSPAGLALGYAALTTVVTPASVPSIISDDPDDDNVLACAAAANADLIVSGDRHLLDLKTFRHRRIVRPAEGMGIINRV